MTKGFAYEQSAESFAVIAAKSCFLGVYKYHGGLSNFHILYKIRRYVDSNFTSGDLTGSYCDQIADDIKQVKNIKEEFGKEIVHAWLSVWTRDCKANFISNQNRFICTSRVEIEIGEDIGFYSYIVDNAIAGPLLMMTYSENPNVAMKITNNKVYFEAIVPIKPNTIITVAKNPLVDKPLDYKQIKFYEECKSCKGDLSEPAKMHVPMLNLEHRKSIIKDLSITDFQKKVYEELFNAFSKMNYCMNCVTHRCTFFQEWPERERVILSSEITYQTWAFSRLLTIENPKLVDKLLDDPAHAYITDDEYDEYVANRSRKLEEFTAEDYDYDSEEDQLRKRKNRRQTKKKGKKAARLVS
eukprot:NODE_524_length_7257_cov_0.465912.p2 type:complete len:355 gc:universal NODE_524_length_7257_cov_0.465912:5766-6830(+)